MNDLPDYYVGNIHKWCLAPVAAAFLWVNPLSPSKVKLHHPIISHLHGGGLSRECSMLGTRDYSSILTVPAALDFIDAKLGGLDALREHNKNLCYEAAVMLSTAWGTLDYISPRGLCAGTAMIGCPANLGDTWDDGEKLRLALRAWKPLNSSSVELLPHPENISGGIVIQKLTPVPGDRLYMRLSAAVYNYIEEYYVLRDAVIDISSRL